MRSLKPLSRQVLVITGATSGIGLVTARQAVRQGAKVFLISRDADALQSVCSELGKSAACEAADVGDLQSVERAAQRCIQRFGGFDTWVNNAGVSVYGKAVDIPIEDHRRVLDTDFWGTVHGSIVAVRHLKQRGGAIINIGSVESDAASPLHASYSAAKHAVKGWTDSLRMEVERDGDPISITLIKPSSVDTPFIDHSRSYMGRKPNYLPPAYVPEVVAETILRAATSPVRDIIVGGAGKVLSTASRHMPRTTDKVMERFGFRAQQSRQRKSPNDDALYEPVDNLRERGTYRGVKRRNSTYTRAAFHPWMAGALMAGTVLGARTLTRGMSSGRY